MDFYRDAVLTNLDEERTGADLTGHGRIRTNHSRFGEKKFNIVHALDRWISISDIPTRRVLAVSVCFIGLIWNKQPPAILLLINPIKFYTENVYMYPCGCTSWLQLLCVDDPVHQGMDANVNQDDWTFSNIYRESGVWRMQVYPNSFQISIQVSYRTWLAGSISRNVYLYIIIYNINIFTFLVRIIFFQKLYYILLQREINSRWERKKVR